MRFEVKVARSCVTITDRVDTIIEAENKVDDMIKEAAFALDLDSTPENLSRTGYSISIKSIGGKWDE